MEVTEKGRKILSFRDLRWEKGPNFGEKVADITSVMVTKRFVNLDFGSFDYEGREEKSFAPKNPFINYHTRIKVEREHFKEIVNMFNSVLKREERGEEE